MDSPSAAAALRSGSSALRRHPLRLVLVLGLLAGDYGAIVLTGGTPNPLVHFLYLPVLVGAVAWGWIGGVLVGMVAGLLAGPLSPDSTASSMTFLGNWGWLIRFLAYQTAGVVAGVIFERSRALAGEIRAAHERTCAEAAIASSESRLRAVVEACADGMLVIDQRGHVTLANAAVERLVRRPRAEIVGRRYDDPAWQITSADGRPILDLGERFRRLMASRRQRPAGEYVLARSDGTPVTVAVTAMPIGVPGDGEVGAVITLRDVTAERALARTREARADDLRGAARLAAAEATAAGAAATLVAEFGRLWPVLAAAVYVLEGDGVHRLAGWSAPGVEAAFPARLAGAPSVRLRRFAEAGRIRRLDLPPLVTDEPWLGPLAAAGGRTTLIVPLPVEGSIVGALVAVDRRDVMAADPDEGGALVEFGQMSAAIVRRAALDEAANATRARARIGVVLDQPELLQPVFQPILSLATGNVVAYEALARFALEPVQPPAVWFDLAARTGLGVELQALAIRRAIETSGERRLPHRASLMLNVSPGLLDQPEITLALGDVGLERIVIEMTEDEPIADYGRVRETMARLRARRIRFGIDDAGAGYASMRHVTELRPEFVKLDAQLISGLGDDSGRQALVRALETFTREIGAKLIAEGVETLADLRLLAATGLPILAQGYAIARPGPAWPSIEPEAVAAVRDARGPSAMLRVVRRHRVLGPAS